MPKKNKSIRAKLIANPGAKQVLEEASRIEQVRGYLLDYGIDVDVAIAHPIRKAIPIVKKAIKNGYDIIIAMGGDGTLGAVIRGMVGSNASLGIISAGTANDIAKSLGIPEDLKEACTLIASGHLRKLDIGQVSTKKNKKFYFFMLTAIGLTATVYPMIKDVPEGKLSGIQDAIKTLLKFDSKPTVYLTLDDESKIKVDSMLVTIANTPIIGLQNLVAPDAVMDDGLLDVAVYPDYSKAELLAYFAKTANEGETSDKTIQRYQARKIKVKTSPKLDVAAEGIILGKGTARIKVLKQALRVIAPEPGAGAEKPHDDVAYGKDVVIQDQDTPTEIEAPAGIN
jgi:YegS/Rv2252/BmrU family lipid kinase